MRKGFVFLMAGLLILAVIAMPLAMHKKVQAAGQSERPMHLAGELAKAFNVDRRAFFQEVNSDKSLAEIAAAHGGDIQRAKMLIGGRLTETIHRANAKGVISDNEAYLLESTLAERLEKAFNKPGLLNFKKKRQAVMKAGADVLGMTPDAVMSELATGKSVQELAEERNIQVAAVTKAMSSQMEAQLSELVADGIMPDFMAGKIIKGINQRIENIVQSKNFGKFAQKLRERFNQKN